MATLEEIRQRETELQKVESQARQQSQTKIIRRRFGTRVTPQQQQDILKQKQQAEQTIKQIGEQRQQLQSIRDNIQTQQSNENKISYISKLANSSIPINLLKANRRDYNLSKNDISDIEEIRAGQLSIQKYKEQAGYTTYKSQGAGNLPVKITVSEQQAQELKPIRVIDYQNRTPTVVKGYGAYDLDLKNIRQLEIQQNQEANNQPSQINNFNQDISNKLNQFRVGIQQSKNPASNVVRSVINAPLGNNRTVGNTATKTVDFFTSVFDLAEQGNPINKPKTRLGKTLDKDARIVSELAFYSATAPVTVPILTISGLNKIYNSNNSNDFFTGVFEVGVGVFAGIGKTSRFLKEPINLDISKKVSRVYLDEIKYIQGNSVQLANFKIVSYKPPTQIIYETRLDILKRSIVTKESNVLFPKNLITLDDASIQFVRSGTAKVKDGKILGSVPVASGKLGKRYSGTTFNILKGETVGLDRITVKRSKDILKATEEYLGFPVSQKNFDLIFGGGKDASGGGLIQKELFKIQSGNKIKFASRGKTVRQAEVTSITVKERQLSETIDLFEGSINIKDVTFPRFREGKDIQIKGITKAEELILDENFIRVLNPISKDRKLQLKEVKQVQEVLDKLKANVLVNTPKIKTVTTAQAKSIITNQLTSYDLAPLIVEGRGLAKSKYYGTGQYERSESIIQLKQPLNFLDLGNNKNNSTNLPKFNIVEIERNILKSINKEIPRNLTKELPQEITRNLNKQINRQVPRQLQRQVNRSINKNEFNNVFRLINKEYGNSLKVKLDSKIKSYGSSSVQAYKTFILKYGKKEYLTGLRPKGEALYFGEKEALKTLRATFGVEKTNRLIKGTSSNYNPKTSYFRDYRIVKGKPIKLNDIYIQKLGKRLVTKSERQAIQSARKKKRRSIFEF